ncbi:MAG: helix-turn-helix transcriptional regulator [Geobacteraceae bacterium]|nr:helix-turn-helix transcriptional regulator [Geobacteraceae bacterium]
MPTLVMTDEIGRKIRAFRQNACLTQEKLAELIDVTPQQIQKYEAGKTSISTTKLQIIANALRVSVSDFFKNHTGEILLNETEAAFVRQLRRIKDSEAQKSIMVILDKLAKK